MLFNYININAFLQSIHDELLSEEIETDRVQTDSFIPHPLVRLQKYLAELKPGKNIDEMALSLNEVVRSCKTEMYHFARVSGVHVLECIMDTALSAVKREQLEEASNVCAHSCYHVYSACV